MNDETCIYCGGRFTPPPADPSRGERRGKKYPMCGKCRERYREDRYGFARKANRWAASTYRKIF